MLREVININAAIKAGMRVYRVNYEGKKVRLCQAKIAPKQVAGVMVKSMGTGEWIGMFNHHIEAYR